jgi:hypothetical protein
LNVLSPVDRVQYKTLSKSNAQLHDKIFNAAIAWLKFQPRVDNFVMYYRFNIGLKLFMSNSKMCGSDYLLQENKMEAFLPLGLPWD